MSNTTSHRVGDLVVVTTATATWTTIVRATHHNGHLLEVDDADGFRTCVGVKDVTAVTDQETS